MILVVAVHGPQDGLRDIGWTRHEQVIAPRCRIVLHGSCNTQTNTVLTSSASRTAQTAGARREFSRPNWSSKRASQGGEESRIARDWEGRIVAQSVQRGYQGGRFMKPGSRWGMWGGRESRIVGWGLHLQPLAASGHAFSLPLPLCSRNPTTAHGYMHCTAPVDF